MCLLNYLFFFTFLAGLLLDKFPKYRFLLLFLWTSLIGIGNVLLPFSGCLPIFFFLCAILGWSTGSLDTGTYDFIYVNIASQLTYK